MGRRPGGSSDDTKQQLLAAAARVFAARGYEGSRVSEIAAEAGLSTGAIYANYGNKADLLCAAIRARGPKALAGLVDAGGSGSSASGSGASGSGGSGPGEPGSVVGILRFLGTRLGTGGPGRRGMGKTSRAVFVESLAASRREPQVAEVLRTSLEQREERFADLVRRGQETGEIGPEVSPAAVARLCMLLLLGSVVTRTVGMEPPPADDWEAVITSLVRNLEPVVVH